MGTAFNYQNYLVRRKVFTFFGAKFHVYNADKELVLFSKLKAFRLKEDVRLFTNESMSEELVNIHARKVLDISSIYDVSDSQTGLKIGGLKRKGLKSILKDEWLILDINDQEIGVIQEDSMGLALIRRFLVNLIPQSYNVYIDGRLVSIFKQKFNPFILKLNLDFSPDSEGVFDKRLGIAAAIMLSAIDGKQN